MSHLYSTFICIHTLIPLSGGGSSSVHGDIIKYLFFFSTVTQRHKIPKNKKGAVQEVNPTIFVNNTPTILSPGLSKWIQKH